VGEQDSHPANPKTLPRRAKLARVQLGLGASAAAMGLFLALHWLGLPGGDFSLSHNRHRSDSVAALERATKFASSHRGPAASVVGARRATPDQAGARRGRRGRGRKTTPRAEGKPIKPAPASPVTKRPGQPDSGSPPAGGADRSGSTESPPAKQVSPAPPPPPPPGVLPPIDGPQLAPTPPVPPVPVPTVPDLPKQPVPGVPSPQVPTLP